MFSTTPMTRWCIIDAIVPGGRMLGLGLGAFAAVCRPVTPLVPALSRFAERYPNAMALSGRERADKLASVSASAHWRASRREVEEGARAKAASVPSVPMVLMPAGLAASGSRRLAQATGASLQAMGAWGHASVLSPGPCKTIAGAVAGLL